MTTISRYTWRGGRAILAPFSRDVSSLCVEGGGLSAAEIALLSMAPTDPWLTTSKAGGL
jgi:hypothetical protein